MREWLKALKRKKKGFVFQLEAPEATTESLEEICHINKGGGISSFFFLRQIKKDRRGNTKREGGTEREFKTGGRRTGGREWDWRKEGKSSQVIFWMKMPGFERKHFLMSACSWISPMFCCAFQEAVINGNLPLEGSLSWHFDFLYYEFSSVPGFHLQPVPGCGG